MGKKSKKVLTEGIIGIKSDVDRASEYTSKKRSQQKGRDAMHDRLWGENKRTNDADDTPSLNARSNKQVYKPKHPDPHPQKLRRHVSQMDCQQNNRLANAVRAGYTKFL